MIKFLKKTDLPDNWDEILKNENLKTYYVNEPFTGCYYCLHFGEKHEDCFYMVTNGEICLIEHAEPNDYVGERKVRAILQDMKWKETLQSKKLIKCSLYLLPDYIKKIFKGEETISEEKCMRLICAYRSMHEVFIELFESSVMKN